MWTLVAERMECSGSPIHFGIYQEVKDISECAGYCSRMSTMFIFENKESCLNDGCDCFCQTVASKDGKCEMISRIVFDLYSVVAGTKNCSL